MMVEEVVHRFFNNEVPMLHFLLKNQNLVSVRVCVCLYS